MNTTQAKTADKTDKSAGAQDEAALTAQIAELKAELERLAERFGTEEPGTFARARDVAGDLQGEMRRIETDIVTATRESPWRSLATAGLVGLVFGLLLRR